MRVIYAGVDIMPLKTHEFNLEAVYDNSGVDYLFTRVTMVVEGLVNGQPVLVDQVPVGGNTLPGTLLNGPPISYAFDGDSADLGTGAAAARVRPAPAPLPGPFPPATAGLSVGTATTPLRKIRRQPNAPVLTHQTIRHRLSTPQQKLFIFTGPGMESGVPLAGSSDPPQPGPICVESPEEGQSTDCKNGPFPKVLSVNEAAGDATTFVVVFAVETYINEADSNGSNPNGALLSNRFSQSHAVDDDGYTTMRTEGTAIFRTDRVYGDPASPDSFRAVLFMPIPLGFTREVDGVKGRDDVAGVDYAYTDTQVKANFVAGPYTQASTIAVVHRQAVVCNADILTGALTAYERILGIAANKNIAKEAKEPAVPAAPKPRGIRPLRVAPRGAPPPPKPAAP